MNALLRTVREVREKSQETKQSARSSFRRFRNKLNIGLSTKIDEEKLELPTFVLTATVQPNVHGQKFYQPVINRVMNSNPKVLRKVYASDLTNHGKTNRFALEVLSRHNEIRADHFSPPLELDGKLCHEAQNWANFLAHCDAFVYRNDPSIGENLLLLNSDNVKSSDLSGHEVTNYWYRERKRYNFNHVVDSLHIQASKQICYLCKN